MDGDLHFPCNQSVAPLERQPCAGHWEVKEHQLWTQGWACGGGISCSGSLLSIDEEPSRMKALSLGNDLDSPGRSRAGR